MKILVVEVAIQTISCSTQVNWPLVIPTTPVWGTSHTFADYTCIIDRLMGGSSLDSSSPAPVRMFSSSSSKSRDPTKKSRHPTTIHQRTSVTADPLRYADDFYVPTHRDRPKPAQVPPITSRHSTTAIYPNSGGETSNYAYTTPSQELDAPEVAPEVAIM